MRPSIGTVIEWYDFYLYAVLAPFLAPIFFPDDPTASVLSALRDLRRRIRGPPVRRDRLRPHRRQTGRKYAFLLTVAIMGGATVLVGLLPGYAQIGILAPIILVTLRLLQGLALGGEYGGAAIYVAEHAPDGKRGLYTSWIQTTATVGLFAALAVILVSACVSATRPSPLGLAHPVPARPRCSSIGALYIRLRSRRRHSSRRPRSRARPPSHPLKDEPRRPRRLGLILLVLIGMTAGQAVVWYRASSRRCSS